MFRCLCLNACVYAREGVGTIILWVFGRRAMIAG